MIPVTGAAEGRSPREHVFRKGIILTGFTRFSGFVLGLLLIGGLAVACPASYVKSLADQNKGTDLYDKSEQIADKYMTDRGMDPDSVAGQITRPYVIGTTLAEHDLNQLISRYSYYEQYNKPEAKPRRRRSCRKCCQPSHQR